MIEADSCLMEAACDGLECALQPAKDLVLSIQVPTKQEHFKGRSLGLPSSDVPTLKTHSGADDRG